MDFGAAPSGFTIGNHATSGVNECNCIVDEFKIYDFNGSGDQADLDLLAQGGDTAEANEYLYDSSNDYTFDFNNDDAQNRGEFIWLGSDSQFQGVNIDLGTEGVDNGAIFSDDFESGDLTAWDSTVDPDGGEISATTTAAHSGTYGLQVDMDDTDDVYVQDNHSVATLYRSRADINPNGIQFTLQPSFLVGYDSSATDTSIQAEVGYSGGSHRIRMSGQEDDSSWSVSSFYDITDDWHLVEIEFQQDSDGGADSGGDDGTLKLWIDGELKETLSGLDNDARDVDQSRLGLASTNDAATGTLYFDDFASWDGTFDYDWEYWDGDSWSALTIAGTHGLRPEAFLDDGTFFFTAPGDWFPYSVNGSTDQYFIRGHLEGGSYSTDPIEDVIKTDILLLQYLSNVTATDQTFVVVPENLLVLLLLMPVLPLVLQRRRKPDALGANII
jgi:hypothetical protein